MVLFRTKSDYQSLRIESISFRALSGAILSYSGKESRGALDVANKGLCEFVAALDAAHPTSQFL